jgi:hypothetical protein
VIPDIKLNLIAVHERLEALWDARWFGITATSIAALLGACFIVFIPVPGVSVAVLGVAAAMMSLRPKATGVEKATWMLILAAFLVIEVLAIRKDRAESYRAQVEALREEREHFAEVGNGIKSVVTQAQNQFQSTMQQSARVIGLQSQSLDSLSNNLGTLTGGQSYAYLRYVPGQQFLFFVHAGRYPLYGVSARIVALDKSGNNVPGSLLGTTIAIGDMIQHHGNSFSVPLDIESSGEEFNTNIFFTARNGDWVELLREKRINNEWVQALRVSGRFTSINKERVLCETIDPKFPIGDGGKIDNDFKLLAGRKPPRCQ